MRLSRLVRIRRDYGGGNVQLAYEYGYGFDGGRRWRKDTVNGVWTRYPCGVACGAGDLVEQTSDLSGSQWTTSALYLQGISLVRRNNEWHHFDPLGTAQVITNNSASVISNNLYDLFGVLRYEQGSAQTPWRYGFVGEEWLTWLAAPTVNAVDLSVNIKRKPPRRPAPFPGAAWFLCAGLCGPVLADLVEAWLDCADHKSRLARLECAVCAVVKEATQDAGDAYALGGCLACLCSRFGLVGGIICGGVTGAGLYLMCRDEVAPVRH
jgi:hypothetical protein